MTLQQRLLVLFLIVVLVPMAETAYLTARVLSNTLEKKAHRDLEVDLKLAWSQVRQRLDFLSRAASQAATPDLAEAATSPDRVAKQQARSVLLRLQKAQRTSFVTLLGPGDVVLSQANREQDGGAYPELTVLANAWKGEADVGVEFIPQDLLESEQLQQRAEIRLETRAELLQEALALVAAVPVLDRSGQVRAVLVAGDLLNNNTVIPDQVGDLTGHILSVWRSDVSIATNSHRRDGARAVGERLPAGTVGAVATEGFQEIVLAGQLQTAIGSQLRNSANQDLGFLLVGIPQAELAEPRQRALLIIALASAGGSAIAIILAFYLARRISRPLGRLVSGTRRVARGDLSVRVPVAGRDEFAEVAQSFNSMMGELAGTQEKLIRSQRLAAIGQLAGSVSHELRNPLSVLRSSAYYLRSKLTEADEKVRKHLNIIEEEIGRSDQIVTDLLDFSRTKPPTLQRTFLNYIVEESLSRIEVPGNVTVELELAEGLPALRADTFQLEQVLMNLLTNAIQAMPAGGGLTVRTTERDGLLLLTVSDTGEGISAEHLNDIFEPLFTTKSRGIGLGLAVCRALVENHKGTITVDSTVGKGTTFTVTFPARPPAAEEGDEVDVTQGATGEEPATLPGPVTRRT